MYLEIENLSKNDLIKLGQLFPDKKIREFYSIYTEICRIEAICSLDNILTNDFTDVSIEPKDYNELLEEAALMIAENSENKAFQELAEEADCTCRHMIHELLEQRNEWI